MLGCSMQQVKLVIDLADATVFDLTPLTTGESKADDNKDNNLFQIKVGTGC
jgi:hypothetical protein